MDGADAAKRMAMAMGFYTAAEPVATVVPMMIALGNHDLRMFRTEQKQSSGKQLLVPPLAALLALPFGPSPFTPTCLALAFAPLFAVLELAICLLASPSVFEAIRGLPATSS